MSSTHKIIYDNSSQLLGIEDASVNLVVTSPPYPMIAMWDEMFGELNQEISNMMNSGKNDEAFELMHNELDIVW